MRIPAIFTVILVALGVAAGYATASLRGADPTAVRNPLAASSHVRGAPGRTLALTSVTVPAGVALARHRHPGTQVSYIQSGTLTYTVRTGSVRVMSGSPDAKPRLVRTIRAGQTGAIKTGQWIVEQPDEIHQARNAGSSNVVILLSTLFPIGAPPSIPVS